MRGTFCGTPPRTATIQVQIQNEMIAETQDAYDLPADWNPFCTDVISLD